MASRQESGTYESNKRGFQARRSRQRHTCLIIIERDPNRLTLTRGAKTPEDEDADEDEDERGGREGFRGLFFCSTCPTQKVGCITHTGDLLKKKHRRNHISDIV